MLKHRPGRQTWIWPSEAVFIRQNNYPLYPGHPFRTQLLRAGARMLCEKDRKRDSDTEQRIHYFDGVLPFPVIQSFGKNVLWEKRESAIWHKAKNLLHWWHFTAFLLTVIDPSHSLRMTSYRLPHHGNRSFTFVQDDDWRFPHYDALPSPVILNGRKNAVWERRETEQWHRVKNLLRWWRLAANS